MKTIIALLILLTAPLFSQSFILDVSYYRAENDMNRTTRTETFSVSGYASAYSIKYGGKVMPNEQNEEKTCDLSQASLDEILASVKDNKIAQNEVFYAKEKTNGAETFYLTIKVNMVLDGSPYEIILDGEANLVKGNKMYLKVIELIKDLRRIIKNC